MRLSAHDASFLYTETASGPMHAAAITIIDGPATFDELYEYYAQRIHLIERLRQRLMFVPFNLAHPKWADDPEFDLANHIRPFKVPKNTKYKRALEYALELGEPLLDRSRPLWLTYVIENIEGKTMVVQLSHHAFVDGATAIAMLTILTDAAADTPSPAAPQRPWEPAPLPTPTQLWQEAVQENAANGLQQAQQGVENATKLASLNQKVNSLMTRMSRPVMTAPWNASLVGPKRAFAQFRRTLDDFKPIRRSLGGSINDIVVSVVAEGAARYLVAKNEQVEDQYLRLMCPVNVRAADDDPLDMTGNKVSGMFPVVAAWPMPIHERYQAVRAELDDIKANEEPQIMDQLREVQPSLPPLAMMATQAVGTGWDPTEPAARAPLPVLPHTDGPRPPLQAGFNFTCTNVPGPTWQQYIAGYTVESTIGTLMLGGNLGCGVNVGSMNGEFTFGITADPRLMPDVDRFAEFVEEAFSDLAEHAGLARDIKQNKRANAHGTR